MSDPDNTFIHKGRFVVVADTRNRRTFDDDVDRAVSKIAADIKTRFARSLIAKGDVHKIREYFDASADGTLVLGTARTGILANAIFENYEMPIPQALETVRWLIEQRCPLHLGQVEPIEWAVGLGSTELVLELVKYGLPIYDSVYDTPIRYQNTRTPLDAAVWKEDSAMVALLLSLGANPCAVNEDVMKQCKDEGVKSLIRPDLCGQASKRRRMSVGAADEQEEK